MAEANNIERGKKDISFKKDLSFTKSLYNYSHPVSLSNSCKISPLFLEGEKIQSDSPFASVVYLENDLGICQALLKSYIICKNTQHVRINSLLLL